MSLPLDFHFSQGSLQDFVDCPRRFQLRYLLNIAWPAVEAEPILENERRLRQGELFHLLAQQSIVGVPAARLEAAAQEDAELAGWWAAFRAAAPDDVPGLRFPELVLSAPLHGEGLQRLVAQYDLVALDDDGRAVIFDWKTSRRLPPRQWLAQRLQTRVYPYLLWQAAGDLTAGRGLQPEQIEMVYWFAGYPAQPERFVYGAAQAREDEAFLHGLVQDIARLADSETVFPLTPVEAHCRFCVYRSLCDRGKEAGDLDEADYTDYDPVVEVDLDFEQVMEIEY